MLAPLGSLSMERRLIGLEKQNQVQPTMCTPLPQPICLSPSALYMPGERPVHGDNTEPSCPLLSFYT